MSTDSIKSKNLLEAIQKGREEEVEARLRAGENVNSVFVMNRTPLHCAVANKMTRIVEKLLKHKPDVTVSKIEVAKSLTLGAKLCTNVPQCICFLQFTIYLLMASLIHVHISR